MKKKVIIAFIIFVFLVGALVAVGILSNKKPQTDTQTDTQTDNMGSDTKDTKSDTQGKTPTDEVVVIEEEKYFKIERTTEEGVILALKEPVYSAYKLIVPSSYDGKNVVEFSVIENDSYIQEIVLADGVAISSVSDCENLKKITMGAIGTSQYYVDSEGQLDIDSVGMYGLIANLNNLEEIVFSSEEGYVYACCWLGLVSIKQISLPANTLRIDTFMLCSNELENLVLPEQLRWINLSFSSSPKMTYVVFNDALELIDTSFNNMISLQYAIIPSVGTQINNSFTQCPNLKLVVSRGSLAEIYAEENGIDYIYTDEFDEAVLGELKPIDGENVTEDFIGDKFFSDEEVNNAIHISGEEYFEVQRTTDANSEITLVYTGDVKEPFVLEIPAMYGTERVTGFARMERNPYIVGVIIPEDIRSDGFTECINLRSVVAGCNTPFVSNCATLQKLDCSKIKFNYAAGEDTIKGAADCPKLTEIVLPESIDTGGNELVIALFCNCGGARLYIPEGVTSAFTCVYNTEGITLVTIPSTMKTMVDSFGESQDLQDVYVYSRDLELPAGTFLGCPNVKLHVYEGSTTEKYAKQNSINYDYIDEE
ncbi:MAG: leucine-rich repeat domain-containing protein [Lachnospiraceae bacterium]|nr:leucine-rich repeat domain-containing protein [Lachnospiraceae bacterium]